MICRDEVYTNACLDRRTEFPSAVYHLFMIERSFDVLTLGFSSRSWDETLSLLREFKVGRLIDIRTLPGSRFAPQFNKEHLQEALPAEGIEYIHMKALGGFRKVEGDDPSVAAWKNTSFRAFAAYMQTAEFQQALMELIRLFQEKTSVYACTEAVFWRCHRALVADALAALGYRPGHIFGPGACRPHQITKFAHIENSRVTYPAKESCD